MKRRIYICTLLCLIIGLGSCKKEGLMLYQANSDIYFLPSIAGGFYYTGGTSRQPVDSSNITFGFEGAEVTDSIFYVPVRISGPLSSEDRTYDLTVDAASTVVEGRDFDFVDKKFVVPANSVVDTIFIKLHRTEAMKDSTFKLILDLNENQNFKTDLKGKITNATTGQYLDYIKYTLFVNDILLRPKHWLDAYLGTFSRKKIYFMQSILGFDIAEFDHQGIGTIVFYGSFTQRYLNEQAAKGNVIYDEDGSPMIMGASVQ